MQARFAILNVLRQAGEGLITLERHNGDTILRYELHAGALLTIVRLDRSKISTVGMKAIGGFAEWKAYF